jgi:hypothetical protein
MHFLPRQIPTTLTITTPTTEKMFGVPTRKIDVSADLNGVVRSFQMPLNMKRSLTLTFLEEAVCVSFQLLAPAPQLNIVSELGEFPVRTQEDLDIYLRSKRPRTLSLKVIPVSPASDDESAEVSGNALVASPLSQNAVVGEVVTGEVVINNSPITVVTAVDQMAALKPTALLPEDHERMLTGTLNNVTALLQDHLQQQPPLIKDSGVGQPPSASGSGGSSAAVSGNVVVASPYSQDLLIGQVTSGTTVINNSPVTVVTSVYQTAVTEASEDDGLPITDATHEALLTSVMSSIRNSQLAAATTTIGPVPAPPSTSTSSFTSTSSSAAPMTGNAVVASPFSQALVVGQVVVGGVVLNNSPITLVTGVVQSYSAADDVAQSERRVLRCSSYGSAVTKVDSAGRPATATASGNVVVASPFSQDAVVGQVVVGGVVLNNSPITLVTGVNQTYEGSADAVAKSRSASRRSAKLPAEEEEDDPDVAAAAAEASVSGNVPVASPFSQNAVVGQVMVGGVVLNNSPVTLVTGVEQEAVQHSDASLAYVVSGLARLHRSVHQTQSRP